jgi:hypothetical protein
MAKRKSPIGSSLDSIADELGLPRRGEVDENLLRSLLDDPAVLEGLSVQERAVLTQCVAEMAESGTSITASSLVHEDYRWEPVSMEKFLTDPYYMGTQATSVFPAVRGALTETFDQDTRPVELVLGGSIGWGKSTMAGIAMTYLLYRLSCLQDPHKYYRIMGGAPIIFGIYSVNIDQAMETTYGKMISWIDAIPYFEDKCPRVKRINSRIKFGNMPVEVIAGSREVHTIGRDLFGFFCLAEGQQVRTPRGPVAVEELRADDLLYAPSGAVTFDAVVPTGMRPCVEVRTDRGVFTVSEDHPVLVRVTTDRVQWVRAVDLAEGSDIVNLDEASFTPSPGAIADANQDLHALRNR